MHTGHDRAGSLGLFRSVLLRLKRKVQVETENTDWSQHHDRPSAQHLVTTSSIPKRYEYRPFDNMDNQIRLLTLWPGEMSSEVHISLNTVAVASCSEPYEALSYCWGGTEKEYEVQVDERKGPIGTTRNLDEALRFLRDKDRPRLLWIDALCVNQENPTERSHQVRLMGKIYSNATHVIAWVGNESKDGRLAMNCIGNIATHVKADWARQEIAEYPVFSRQKTQVTGQQLEALASFFQRPWFGRLWIWQEIQLGYERAVVLCGKHKLSWSSICAAVFLLSTKRFLQAISVEEQSSQVFLSFSAEMEYIRGLCDTRSLDLLRALHRTRTSNCLDARDKVYAILSIVNRGEYDIGLRPDYTKSTVEVYTEAATKYMETYSSLNMFQYVGTERSLLGLPSWVPDWSAGGPHRLFQMTNAGLKINKLTTNVKSHHELGNVLRVEGKVVGRIDRVMPFCEASPSGLDHDLIVDNFRRMVPRDIANSILEGDRDLLRSVCTVVCGNSFSDRIKSPDQHWPEREQCERVVFALLRGKSDFTESFDMAHLLVLDTIGHYCMSRALGVTLEGIGLVPLTARPGDVVSALLGCDTAVVLRPVTETCHEVVGAAFYDGVMEGEAFLGKLPLSVQSVQTFRLNSSGWGLEYRYKDGESLEEDPRLGPLPAGWYKTSNEGQWSEGLQVFENTITGEHRAADEDPRFDYEALKQRCVDLQSFDLV